ncbi:hypothetical protein HOLleu_16563 [Holothuria leucospilota]|uniref:Uncharacterized protein n=1 Tax=Holothuria leucospilota TaxID=206669 RepID=A0A9Q1HBA0_HOLLE|nr:hypothetical protein HOLleu_16563 [Holothuria leucospilota]
MVHLWGNTGTGTTSNTDVSTKNSSNAQWTPPVGRNPHIDSFVDQVRGHLENFLQSTLRLAPYNLSLHERKALRDLKNNNDIVILEADKGGAITLLNWDAYVREASTQLSNKDFYIQIDSDPTETYHKALISLLKLRTRPVTHPPSPPGGQLLYHPQAPCFANLFMALIETQFINKSSFKGRMQSPQLRIA